MKIRTTILFLLISSIAFGQTPSFPSLAISGTVQYSYYAILNLRDRTDRFLVLSANKLSASTVAVGGGYRAVRATIGVASTDANPLVYWEETITSGTGVDVAISNTSWNLTTSAGTPSPGQDVGGNSWGYLMNGGGANQKAHANTYTTYGATFGAGDVIMVALDMTNGFIYYGKNNVWLNSGDPTSGATGTGAAFSGLTGRLYPTVGCYGGNQYNVTVNFGATSFTYTPPAGYVGLHH